MLSTTSYLASPAIFNLLAYMYPIIPMLYSLENGYDLQVQYVVQTRPGSTCSTSMHIEILEC